jgi:DNA-binding NarL/FixJ family response regulator
MKLLIMHETALLREGLMNLICQQSFFDEVEHTDSITVAAEIVTRFKPDLVLMSFDLADGNGADAIEIIRLQAPGTRFFFLSKYTDKEHLLTAIQSGAKGYLHHSVSPQELLASLIKVAGGEAVIPGFLLDALLDEILLKKQEIRSPTLELTVLTQRELDVLYHLALGESNHEIAAGMYLSENTIRNHVHSILTKLNLTNRRQVARFAHYAPSSQIAKPGRLLEDGYSAMRKKTQNVSV